jgi:hypothetical protein
MQSVEFRTVPDQTGSWREGRSGRRTKEHPLVYYRIYRLDERGRFASSDDVSCTSDQDALARATTMLSCYPKAEVWERTRFVGTVHRDPSRALR